MRRVLLSLFVLVLLASCALAPVADASTRASVAKTTKHKAKPKPKHKAKPEKKAKPKAKAKPRGNGSLTTGSGQLPGPSILYRSVAAAPPLTNTGVWKAAPILVSGTAAYRSGEYMYQDYLYDDHGARLTIDPNDPQTGGSGSAAADLFSMPNGTIDYPTGAGYDNNAADLVEFRVKPLASTTAFRVTLNTLANPNLIAFSVALGGTPGQLHAFPFGANVNSPAAYFLTVHPQSGHLVGSFQTATGATVAGPAPAVKVDLTRHQIEVDVSHTQWNPRRSIVRMAMGVGLWDGANNRYLVPQALVAADHSGGAGVTTNPAAFLNVAFRFHEPLPSVTASTDALVDSAWWRDHDQGHALAANDISNLYANVDFGKLAKKSTDTSQVPRYGAMDRILPTHFNLGPGVQYANECGFGGSSNANSCVPEYLGQLQPYAVYIPSRATDRGRYGLTLLLHSLSANYNQFIGSRNQSQFANRPQTSIVITTESRGPDQFYQGVGGAEVFEAWADIAHLYKLDPDYSDIAGYSMGGFGTFRLGGQFPDLFARAQPTVGEESDSDVLASFRNLPLLMWNGTADELVDPALYLPDASQLGKLGYRYELDAFQPCANPGCSPLFPNHLQLAVNDQYRPAARFLASAHLDPNPAHVTYVDVPSRNRLDLGLNGDHAYWVSAMKLRNPSLKGPGGQPMGEIDAVSKGFGAGDAPTAGLGGDPTATLTGGNLGTLLFARSGTTWGAVPATARQDVLDVTATNVASASVDPKRAHLDCHATVALRSDGPFSLTLVGCGRTVRVG